MKQTVYLVIGADREIRVAKRPRLSLHEVAFRVNIEFDDTWGKVIGDINLTAPPFDPTAEIVPS